MDDILDALWVEKYRPKTLDDILISPEIKNKILEFKEQGTIPHLLLVGEAGIGKTSLAKILVNDILDCECEYINASDKGGIDTIRNTVRSFASSASFLDKIKVVVFGEADGLTPDAQDSLKEIIEECSHTTRFIFTANNVAKLTKPIVSRCQRMDIRHTIQQYVGGLVKIVKSENVKVESTADFQAMAKDCFPDFRLAINNIQFNTHDGVFKLPKDRHVLGFAGDLLKKITTVPAETVRAYCIQKSEEFDTHVDLMISLCKVVCKDLELADARKVVMILNDSMWKDAAVVDRELNFYCALIQLSKLFGT